jgi:hypothetical protein
MEDLSSMPASEPVSRESELVCDRAGVVSDDEDEPLPALGTTTPGGESLRRRQRRTWEE